jgi:hypothetical protein
MLRAIPELGLRRPLSVNNLTTGTYAYTRLATPGYVDYVRDDNFPFYMAYISYMSTSTFI